tara:strand:+ start:1008 stop:2219 length:1212 start_codon:yes stop_codon:yes gene_type:complete
MRFPKVLIISEFSFDSNSGGGLLFKNLFDGYPKEKIGLIHEDIMFKDSNVGLLICLKNKNKLLNTLIKFFPNKLKSFLKSILFFVKKLKKEKHVSSDINFFHKESIQKFKPEIIYTILGSQELMLYIKYVHEYFNLPLIIHIMDNWISDIKDEEIEKKNLLQYFLNSASTRIAINEKMAKIYSQKFNKKFEIVHNSLDRKKIKKINNLNKLKVITYIGSVYKNVQLDSLIRISQSVISLSNQNNDLQFQIYLPNHQLKEFKLKFPKHFSIKIGSNNFDDNEYFSLISKSNLLILASNFDKKSVNYYKYSWPAKMPSYLMSGVPIFILGPKEVFFISEAKQKNWAYVCNQNDESKIKKSIYRILFDDKIKEILIKNAIEESKNFEIEKMKKNFLNIINQNRITV